jgi:membrane protein involved in colicin uptake
VQVQRISGKPRTKLDELLSLFEQDNFEDFEETAKFYNYKLSDPDIKAMAKILEHMSADQKLRAELEAEAEEDRTRNEWLRNQKRRDAEEAKKNAEEAKRHAERANKLAVELDAEKQKSAEQAQALSAKDAEIAELKRQLAKNRGR